MGALKGYLRPSTAGRTKTVYLEGFTDEEGKPLPFIVKSISPAENEAISKRCTNENGKLDPAKYNLAMLVACTQEPDFTNAELCEFYNTMDPEMVPNAMFSIGEKQILLNAIMDINDVKKATKQIMAEAKNS